VWCASVAGCLWGAFSFKNPAATSAWLRKEVPEGKLRQGFWIDLAKKINKAFKHWE
jgi:hypothetical protein